MKDTIKILRIPDEGTYEIVKRENGERFLADKTFYSQEEAEQAVKDGSIEWEVF